MQIQSFTITFGIGTLKIPILRGTKTLTTDIVLAWYTMGLGVDEPLAMLRGGTTSFYGADGLGSVTSMFTTTGALAKTYTYDAYGKLTGSMGSVVNPYQ